MSDYKARLIDAIIRCDKMDTVESLSTRSIRYLEGLARGAVSRARRSGRTDVGDVPLVDPDDTSTRSARGANSAVRDPGAAPDVESMDLFAVKSVAMSIGSYGNRQALAARVLARLRALGADQVADIFQLAWETSDLAKPSDLEAEEDATSRVDELGLEEEIAKANLRQHNATAHQGDKAARNAELRAKKRST